jgi:hypothetical protein
MEAAGDAAERSGTLTVEAVLRRVVHPPVRGADGPRLPKLVEYRLMQAVVVPGRREYPRGAAVRPHRGAALRRSPWANDPPQLPDGHRHVGDEEDTEHAHDRVEVPVGQAEVEQVLSEGF